METKTQDICEITTEPIRPSRLNELFDDPSCGALTTFTGKVRDHHKERAVLSLTYEANTPMSEKILREIIGEARRALEVKRLIVVHRIGDLSVGEVAVWIGVESAHRDSAFGACRYIIEEIKKRVPIWKKERGVDGSERWLEVC